MFSKTIKLSMVLMLSFSTLSLASCKGRVPAQAEVKAEKAAPKTDDFYNNVGNDTSGGSINSAPVASASPNASLGVVKLPGWQAKGIAVSGGTMYVSAFGTVKLVLSAGTVLKIAGDGKVKDFATGTLGLTHPIAKTVEGIAIGGGKLVVADSAKNIYTVDSTSGKVTTVKGNGAKDVAFAGGNVYIANGSVEKSDATVAARSPLNGLSASGGIGGDNTGNVYAVSGNAIKKADPSGQVMDVITSDLSGPVDVAVDSRNGDIYVLEMQNVKRFNSSGALLTSFPSTASKPVAITVDESGIIYVADTGNDAKDSKVIKFAAGN